MYDSLSLTRLLLLSAGLVVIYGTARQRRADGWPFIVVGTVGCFTASNVALAFLGVGDVSILGVSLGWLVLVYLSLFWLTEKGKPVPTWRCPECRCFNPGEDVLCRCGTRAPELAANPGRRTVPPLTLGIWPQILDRSTALWAVRQGTLTAATLAGLVLSVGFLLATNRAALTHPATMLYRATGWWEYSPYSFGISFDQQLALDMAWWRLFFLILTLVFAGLAYGIHRLSRLAAVAGLALTGLYLMVVLLLIAQAETLNFVLFRLPDVVVLIQLFLPLFAAVQFAGSVRGTIAYHRFYKEERRLPDAAVEEAFS